MHQNEPVSLGSLLRALGLAVLLVLPRPTEAQTPPPLVPVLRISIGLTQLPEPLVETCAGPRTFPTIEASAGLLRGAWAVEAQAAGFGAVTISDCATIGALHESGTHTDQVYPFERGHGDKSVAALLRYAPTQELWGLGVGAGRFLSADVPFLVGSGALRTRGPVSAVMEAQTRMTRLPYDVVTAEWAEFAPAREIAREREHEWHISFALRLGVELHLR